MVQTSGSLSFSQQTRFPKITFTSLFTLQFVQEHLHFLIKRYTELVAEDSTLHSNESNKPDAAISQVYHMSF